MDSVNVKVGQKVSVGSYVGKSGNTGRSTGAHLHYEVKNSKGSQVNPSNFMGKSSSSSSGGYSNYKMYGKQPSAFNSQMNVAVQRGKIPTSEVKLLTELIGRESSWRSNADNPTSTAYGYGQFIKATRQAYEKKTGLSYSDPVNQIIMTYRYIKDRYGSTAKALQFWDKNKYY